MWLRTFGVATRAHRFVEDDIERKRKRRVQFEVWGFSRMGCKTVEKLEPLLRSLMHI